MIITYKIAGYHIAKLDTATNEVTCDTCSLSFSAVRVIKMMAECGIHRVNFDGAEIELYRGFN